MSDKKFNPDKMHKLDTPERERILPKQTTLEHLHMQRADDVLDLGAGTGYFTLPLADMTDGTVYALDVEPKMLTHLQDRINDENVNNITLVEGQIESVPLEDSIVDGIVASMVLHEVEPLEKGIGEIHRLLKKGGKCICVEWEKVEHPADGPPPHHRIHSQELVSAFQQHGFHVNEMLHPSEEVYMISLEK